MRLIDADAFDKCLEGAEIEATKNRKYVFSGAINTIRGNLANAPTIEPPQQCISNITLNEEDLKRIVKEQIEEIKKLLPQKGEWIDYSSEGFVECPFCHSATNCDGNKDELYYCFSCGAKLGGDLDEVYH